MSSQKQRKHIDDMRREVVELCSTTSSKVKISRMWEAATGNMTLNNIDDDEYVNVLIYNRPDNK
jgi:hypothetical protein